MRNGRIIGLVVSGSLLAFACSGDIPQEDTGTTEQELTTIQRVLGFERVSATASQSDWILGPGSSGAISPSTTHTEGAAALQMSNLGWAQLQSVRIGPVGSFTPAAASFDLRVSGTGTLPWGDAIFQYDAPSKGILNQQAGQVLLGGKLRGVWQTISIPLTSDLVTKLGSASDLSVRISINLPTGSTALFDKYRFGNGGSGASGGAGGAGGASGGTAGSGGSGGKATGGGTGTGGTSGTGATGGSGGLRPVEFFFQMPRQVAREALALDAYGSSLTLGDYSQVLGATSGFSSVADVNNTLVTEFGIGAELLDGWSQSDVLLKSNARLHGNLTTQGHATKQAGAVVDGTTAETTSLDPLQRPSWIVNFPLATLPSQTITTTQAFAPGAYGPTVVKLGGRLKLSPGLYTFKSLSIESGGTAEVNNTSSAIFVYVETSLSFSGQIVDSDPTNNILWGVAGTIPVDLFKAFRGVVVVPYARLTLYADSSTAHSGAFFAREILLKKDGRVKHRPFTPGNFCTLTSACDGLCPCPPGGPCDDNTDCSPGVRCSSGVCGGAGGSCTTPSQCAPGLVCPNGACIVCTPTCSGRACGSDDGCGTACPCGTKIPGDPCVVDADCAGGVHCSSGTCGGAGASCPPACAPGLTCKDGTCACVPSCVGKTCGASDGCGGKCTCGSGEGGCQTDADCDAGLACSNGTCAPPVCLLNPIIFGCGFEGALCGPCTKFPVCESDADCPPGLVCPPTNGTHYLLPGKRVCEAPGCLSQPQALGCGTATSPCGVCPRCIPNCDGKQCGETSDDGCGGRCVGLCSTDGTSTCETNTDCRAGALCLPADLGCLGVACAKTCRPADPCATATLAPPNCGTVDAVCGPRCPAPIVDDVGLCPDRQCGEDPLHRASCGSCGAGQFCTQGGRCAPVAADDPIQVPTGTDSPPTRTVTPPPSPSAVPVGATPGVFMVTDAGSSSYSIPLEVPPGRAGIAPSLALEYTSSSGNDALGLGWHLDGLSTIEACGRTYALDGQSVPPRGFNPLAGDAYCLDGQRLIPTGAGGREFRTAVDTFSKIIAEVGGDTAVYQFTVYRKDGQVLTYGGFPGTAVVRVTLSGSAAHTYGLSKIADRSGNFMRITYLQVPARDGAAAAAGVAAELLPQAITYTGHGDADGNREVFFNYEGRDDTLFGSGAGGIPTQRTQRLRSIEVRARGNLVRRYDLRYDASSGQSRLMSVQEAVTPLPCSDAGAICRPATTFQYFDDGGFGPGVDFPLPLTTVFSNVQTRFASPFGLVHEWSRADGWGTRSPRLSDLGAADERRAHRLSSLFGETSATQTTPLPGELGQALSVGSLAYSNPALGIGSLIVGLVNLLGSEQTEEESYISVPYGPLFKDASTTGIEYVDDSPPRWLFVREPTGGETLHDSPNSTWLLDVDGDGVQDKIWCAPETGELDYKLAVAKNVLGDAYPQAPRAATHTARTGSIAPIFSNICRCLSLIGPKFCLDAPAMSLDVDGDGTPNLIFHDDEESWAALDFSSGTPVWRTDWFSAIDGVISVKAHYIVPADVNGDGLRDLVALAGGYTECEPSDTFPFTSCHEITKPSYVAYNTGTGFDVRVLEADPSELPPPDGLGGIGALHAPDNPLFIMDLDHDGKEELLEPGPDRLADPGSCFQGPFGPPDCRRAVRPWLTRRVVGSTIFREPVASLAARLGEVGDFDGDGNLDVIAIGTSSGRFEIHRGSGRTNGLLKSVTDGLGRRTDVKYDNKNDAGELVFDSGLGDRTASSPIDPSCRWPYRCTEHLDNVLVSTCVDSHYQDRARTDLKVDRQMTYSYKGSRTDVAGHGWLGFWERHELIQDSAGAPLGDTLTTYQPPPAWDPQLSSIPYVHVTTGLVEQTIETFPATDSPFSLTSENLVVTATNTWQTRVSSASRPFPFLQESVEETAGATSGGAPEPLFIRRETSVIDAFGNIITRTTTGDDIGPDRAPVPGSHSSVTVGRTYDPTSAETSAWLISLLKSETLTATPRCTDSANCALGSRTRHRTFEYYPGTTLLHFEHREPNEASNSSPARMDTEYVRADSFGNVTAVVRTEPLGGRRETLIGYDARGVFPISNTDVSETPTEAQQTTQFRFDDRFGKISVRTDPNGVDETWSYDEFGREREHDGPDGQKLTDYAATDFFVADDVIPGGLPIVSAYRVAISQTGGSRIETDYNPLDQVVRRATAGYNGAGVLEEFSYDQRQRLDRRTRPHLLGDGSQSFVQFDYDGLGRLRRETFPDGATSIHDYGLARFVTSNPEWSTPGAIFVRRDQVGLLLSPSLKTVELSDRDARAVRRVDGLGKSTGYTYGPFDELEVVRDPAGRTVTTRHDAWLRTVSVEDAARGGVETSTYNGFDDVTSIVDASQRGRTYFYDGFGRREHAVDNDGETRWIYDGDGSRPNEIGRVVETVSPTGSHTTYGYEAPTVARNRGLVTRVTQHLVAPGSGESTRDLTTDYTYDGFSRLERIDYPEAFGTRPSVHYGHDDFGHVIEAIDGNDTSKVYWKFVAADQGFRIKQERLGTATCGNATGTLTARSYEALTGELASINTKCGSVELQNLTYGYDLAGRLTHRSDTSTGRSENFRYDALGRVTHINNVEFYRYDPDGRGRLDQLRTESAVNSYAYQPQGRDWIQSAGASSYTQDLVGNVKTRNIGGVTQSFEYTDFDLPSRITAGSNITDFAYTAGGARAVKKSPTATTFYAGDHHQDIEDGSGTRHSRSMIYVGSRAVAAITTEGPGVATTRYLYDDAVGSVHTTATENGTLESVRDYSPFGDLRSSSASLDNVPYGFTGHEEDTELGLTNMKARLYDPGVGQFLAADPVIQDPASQGLNRYAYVNNSPLNFVDPSGTNLKDIGKALLDFAGRVAESAVLSYAGGYVAARYGNSPWLNAEQQTFHGALNGAFTGYRHIYSLDLTGLAAFGLDSTQGITGTALGNYVNVFNTLGMPFGSGYSDDLSARQNRQVFTSGFRIAADFANTQGNVISNFGRHGAPLLGHETEHIWQNRLFGPSYQSTYFHWTVIWGFLAGGVDLMEGDLTFRDVGPMAYRNNPWEAHAFCEHNPGSLKKHGQGETLDWFCVTR